MIESTDPASRPLLLTGASGLIGRAALSRLSQSHRVFALSREEPSLALPGQAQVIVHDLRSLEDPPLTQACDTIIHLAQSPRYRDFPQGASDVFELNVGATQRLLDWGRRHGVKRFVYASSGGVYGFGQNIFDETATPQDGAAVGHYIASKYCGELLARAYSREMTVIVLRFFFVYGPEQRQTMLIPRLIDSVLQDRPITLAGEHGLRLNPIYVDDAAAAIEAAVGLEASEIINVAGPQILSLREIATLIGEAAKKSPRFDIRAGEQPKHLLGSTRKMERLLITPQIGFKEGIERTFATLPSSKHNSHAL